MDVFISGIGMTRFGKSKDPLEKMMAEAAALALKDAEQETVDAIYIGVMNAEEFVGDSNFATLLADTLGLTGVPSTGLRRPPQQEPVSLRPLFMPWPPAI